MQVLTISIVPTWPRPLLVALHALSYVLAGAFLWRNRAARAGARRARRWHERRHDRAQRRHPARRPGRPAPGRAAVEREEFVNSGVVDDPVLPWLGDVFASPSWLPLHNVSSAGDLVILAGAV